MNANTKIHSLAVIGVSFILCGLFPGMGRAGEGPEPPPIPRTQPLTYYSSLVNTKLPSFSSSMLTVANGPNWMAGKTVHQVAVAMMDSDPGTIVTSGSVVMGYDPPDGPRRIRLEFGEGYIRYTNRDRSFHTGSPCVAVSATEAENALLATVSALSLPTTEWNLRTVNTVMERSVSGEGETPSESTCEIEQMVTMTRKASNGYPVFDSWARESVSNLNERARLQINWPQFVMETGLIMRSRTDVINDMAQQILQAESGSSGLGAEVDLEVLLGYAKTSAGFVPVARGSFADIYNRYAGQILYVPLAYNPSSDVDGREDLAALQFRVRVDVSGGVVLAEFYLPAPETVRLTIMDVSGREIAVLTDAAYSTGWHQVEWNMRDHSGRRVAAGIYFARLWAGKQAPTRKILVIQ